MADSLEERKTAVANAMGASPQNTVEGGETGNDTDYYKQLKDESYRAMLDSEIQADVAKSQAQKYVGNSLKASGFAGQGMAESSRLGIVNTYNAALSESQAVNNQNQIDIANQEVAAKNQETKDNFESMTTLMANASDTATMNKILGNYNIFVDDNGKLSGDGYDALDQNSKNQLASLYNLYSSQYGDSTYSNSIDQLNNLTYMKGGDTGSVHTLGENFVEETKMLVHYGNNGRVKENGVVAVTNGQGDTIYMQWNGSGYKMVDEKTYNAAPAKYTIGDRNSKNKTSTWAVVKE